MDRASDYGSEGWRFESSRARHSASWARKPQGPAQPRQDQVTANPGAAGEGLTDPPEAADDERFMARALEIARSAARHGEVPVGAVVVLDGEIVGEAHNLRETDQDPTAHAEVVAIRRAAQELGSWRLNGCTLYATLEPCAMCTGAAVSARVRRLVYACRDPKAGAVRSLFEIADDGRLNHCIEVCEGVLMEESSSLLRSFFARLRTLK